VREFLVLAGHCPRKFASRKFSATQAESHQISSSFFLEKNQDTKPYFLQRTHKQHDNTRNLFIMSGMVANLAIILGSMQLSKYIDWEDKSVLQNIRLLYLASNVIMFASFAYMYTQIQKKQGPSLLLCYMYSVSDV